VENVPAPVLGAKKRLNVGHKLLFASTHLFSSTFTRTMLKNMRRNESLGWVALQF